MPATHTTDSTGVEQLLAIQYLRGLAVLMVVVHHARNSNGWLFNPLEGYPAFAWGVDLFFVISGLIMYYAARNASPVDFLAKRVIRVVPLYWIATLTFVLINTGFHPWSINLDTFHRLLKSLLFIPHYHPAGTDRIWPYLIPGWTLNYEMFLYFLFMLGLCTRRLLSVTTPVIIGLVAIGPAYQGDSAVVVAFTRPILLEFLAGIWIARAYVRGRIPGRAAVLLPMGLTGLLCLPTLGRPGLIEAGKILFSTMAVAGAISFGRVVPRVPILQLLGDASYSIYLTHVFLALRLADTIGTRMAATGWLQFFAYLTVSIVLSIVIGISVYLGVERPLLHKLKSVWNRHRRCHALDHPQLPRDTLLARSSCTATGRDYLIRNVEAGPGSFS